MFKIKDIATFFMKKYDPKIHNRRSIRLEYYDYSIPDDYFITICTHNRKCIFGYIKNGKMIFNDLGRIIREEIINISKRYKNIEIDEYIIMPNHIHMIISILFYDVGATLVVAQNRAGASPAPTIGDIVGSFKSICFYRYKKYLQDNEFDTKHKFWQRNYWEHIIRNEKSLNKIRNYIINNPFVWNRDRNNPSNF